MRPSVVRAFLKIGVLGLSFSLLPPHSSDLMAKSLPSLFRGVVVADDPSGVRVVSVEAGSQAALGDLRPEDVLVQVNGTPVRTIDEFAERSRLLKGTTAHVEVLVLRNGQPQALALHLYSYPLLRAWGIEFVPDHDLRFAQPHIGLAYWSRLGRGFEDAGKPAEALNAYLNGLHNAPDDVAAALKVSELSLRVSQQQLQQEAMLDGISSLRQALVVMEKLFDHSLTEEQLQTIKRELESTLQMLRKQSALLAI